MNRFDLPALVPDASPKLADPVAHLEPLGVPFRRFSVVLRRRAWVLFLTTAVGIGIAVLLMTQTPKTYTAFASVLIEPQHTQVSDLQATSTEPENVPNMMRTQIDILRSPELARRVVIALNLTNISEFVTEPSPVVGWIKLAREKLGLKERVRDEENEDIVEIAALKLIDKVYFGNETRSNVLRIFAETTDPLRSAAVANEFAHQFLEFKRHLKFDATQRAHEWFQDQLRKLAVKVRQADQEVQTYREQHGLTDFSAARNGIPGQPSTNVQQLAELSRQLAAVSAERSRRESALDQANYILRTQGKPDSLPSVIQSSLDQRLREQEAMAAGRESQLAATVGEKSPELQAVRSLRYGLQKRIQDEMSNIVLSLATSVTEVRLQEKAMRESLDRVRAAVSNENAAEVGLHSLLAEAQASRSIYESFLNRATQLANVAGIQEADASLVSRAVPPPSPSAPKAVRFVGVAVFLSLSVGLGVVLLLDRLRTGYSTLDDMEADLGVNSLGLIPSVTLSPRPVVPTGKRAFDFNAALSKVRGTIQVLDPTRRPKVVMITSAVPREGKSIVAISLATSSARAGWRTLLIDCDMRCPTVSSRLGLSADPGLEDLLGQGDHAMPDSFIRRLASGLHVIPAGRSNFNPQDLLASRQMANLLDYARSHYDFVVLDSTPVLPVADALVLSRQADATILAVRWESTQRAIVRKALRLLHITRAPILGTLLTQVNLRTYGLTDTSSISTVHRKYRDYFSVQA